MKFTHYPQCDHKFILLWWLSFLLCFQRTKIVLAFYALWSSRDCWKAYPHLLLCVLLQSGSESHASSSFPRPELPIVQKPCKCFGTALSSSTAYYFWLRALLTWIQLHAFSTAAGVCLASTNHGRRAFLTLYLFT